MQYVACRMRTAMIYVVVLLLGACTQISSTEERSYSYAMKPQDDSPLTRIAVRSASGRANSGFRLLPTPPHSLHARLELSRRSVHTLDVQYYLVENDPTGRQFLRNIRDAARRGVRVRVLLDDLHTAGADALLAGLEAEQNVQVRLFNPFPVGREHLATRILTSLFNLKRLHRRMHNKLFIADGAMAVIGGRNIGDDYFQDATSTNFIDIDALAVGDVVAQLQRSFDSYWNSEYVFPLSGIAPSTLPVQLRQDQFEALTHPTIVAHDSTPEKDLLGYQLLSSDLDRGVLPLIWADAVVVSDSPGKALASLESDWHGLPELSQTVRLHLQSLVRAAEHEVVETSPYLIPGEDAMTSIHLLRARNVAVTMVTNSLAGTDASVVHTGYRRYRPALLQAGVQLYEISPARMKSARRDGRFASAGGRLHGKAVIVDGRQCYIGSLNLDPRSELYNTELGVFISSAELAAQLKSLVELIMRDTAMRVSWVAGEIQWSAPTSAPGAVDVQIREPETSWWRRVILNVLAPIVPESML